MLRCGHCKHLTPEYKKLGEAVAKDPKLKNSVVIAKVVTAADTFKTTCCCSAALEECMVVASSLHVSGPECF